MSHDIMIISTILNVFPQVIEAAQKYKFTEPDRESRGISRNLATEKILFEQSVQKILLLSHSSSIHDDAWLQRLRAEIGDYAVQHALHDLQTICEQLETLKAELRNAGRGKEVLDKIRGRAPWKRGQKNPRTRLQVRVDDLGETNWFLASRFLDRQTVLSCPRVTQTLNICNLAPVDDLCLPSAELTVQSEESEGIAFTLKVQNQNCSITSHKLQSTGSTSTLQDWIRLHVHHHDHQRRLQLALQLSFAVVQLLPTPWIDGSWTWGNWAVPDYQTSHNDPCTLFFHRTSPQVEKSTTSTAVWSILSREPVLARLGLCLIELVFAQTISDIRREDAGEDDIDYEKARDHGVDSLDFYKAKQILASRRIRDEFGQLFEDAVRACIHQQFRSQKDGGVIELGGNRDSFLPQAVSSIISPLELQVMKYLRPGTHNTALSQGVDDYGPVGAFDNNVVQSSTLRGLDAEEVHTQPPGSIDMEMSDGFGKNITAETKAQTQLRSTRAKQITTADDFIQKSRQDDVYRQDNAHENKSRVIANLTYRRPAEKKSVMEQVQAGMLDVTMPSDGTRAQAQHRAQRLDSGTERTRYGLRPSLPSIHSQDDSEWVLGSVTETTTDSASVWVADDLDDPPEVLTHQFLLELKPIALRVVLRSFHAWKERSPGHSGNAGSSPPRHFGPSRKHARQKSEDRGDAPDDDDEDDEGPPNGDFAARKRQRTEDSKPTLACPFFKLDPQAHRSCMAKKLTRIRDVKQHLKRRHIMPIYCAICNLICRNESERDVHTRQRNCEEGTNPQPQGITISQQNELGMRVSRRLSMDDQWFSIWDLLFPGKERPQSPYIDTSLFESSLAYHEFMMDQGPTILQRVLSAGQAWRIAGNADFPVFQRQILEDGLNQIFEEWVRRGVGIQPSGAPTVGESIAAVDPIEGGSGSGDLLNVQTALSVNMMDDVASTSSAHRTGPISFADSSDYVQSHSDMWGNDYGSHHDIPDFSEIIRVEDMNDIQHMVASHFSGSSDFQDFQGGTYRNFPSR